MAAAFIALSDEEADYVCDLLVEAGIDAGVVESYLLGPCSEGFRNPDAEVWVYRGDLERAKPILDDYMLRGNEWRLATWKAVVSKHREMQRRADIWYAGRWLNRDGAESRAAEDTVEVTCEECGRRSAFPAVLRGYVQDCPHCGAGVDIGETARRTSPTTARVA